MRIRKFLIFPAVLASLLIPVAALAFVDNDFSRRGNMMSGGFDGGWLMMILFWILLIGAIALSVKWMYGAGSMKKEQMEKKMISGKISDKAMDILRERFARGEIGEEEFEKRKNKLASGQ
ncbi:MAG: SHOCT domain-containing protein [Patescibacteria group bacterium]